MDLDTISRADGLVALVAGGLTALFLGWAGAVLERAWRRDVGRRR